MVDVEKIMMEIREEIKKNGLDKEILSFEEVPLPNVSNNFEPNDEEFDIDFFMESTDAMNSAYKIQTERVLLGNPISVFIKKIIRKFIRFYIIPIINDQTSFNAYTVRSCNSIRNYIIQSREDKKRIEELEVRLASLEKTLKEKQD